MRRLEEIDFDWNIRNAVRDKMFAALANYRREHGHCNISQSCPENPSLGRWVSRQRYLRKGDQLGQDRIQRLEDIDFAWEIVDTIWEQMFSALTEYKRKHGDCNVPQKWSENRQLGAWVSTQRQVKRKDKLPKELVRRLDALGFVWDPANAHWEEMFASLEKYMHMHGNCNVSRDYPDNPRLGAWVIKQRAAMNDGKLGIGRRLKFEKIGLIPKPADAAWEEMFSSLSYYKNEHGNCNVSQKWSGDQRLANWVCNQRQFKRKGHLDKHRVERLEELGFVWDPISAFWDKMFAALVDYKRKHGHCNVPTKWSENRQLASWVVNQRSRQVLLSDDRVRNLEQLGFQWQIHGVYTDRELNRRT